LGGAQSLVRRRLPDSTRPSTVDAYQGLDFRQPAMSAREPRAERTRSAPSSMTSSLHQRLPAALLIAQTPFTQIATARSSKWPNCRTRVARFPKRRMLPSNGSSASPCCYRPETSSIQDRHEIDRANRPAAAPGGADWRSGMSGTRKITRSPAHLQAQLDADVEPAVERAAAAGWGTSRWPSRR
jgi:hypothetical protein